MEMQGLDIGSRSYAPRVVLNAVCVIGLLFSATSFAADTQKPTAPTTLAATVVSGTQINLSWKKSTDNVGVTGYRIERCTGTSCTTFVQVGTTTTALTFNNTGLTNGTSYRYQVKANDAAGNISNPSNIVTAATPDTQAPLPPTSLTATATSATQINLSWPPATDNVGVTGYKVERCTGASCTTFAQISTPTTTSYSNTGLTASTVYRYQVRAADAAGNVGSPSPIAAATTPAPPDTQLPVGPTSLTATAISATQINLSWPAATDNSGSIASYKVERCQGSSCTTFTQIATPTTTSYSDTGLTASTTYRYQVRATDAAGNTGAASPMATATTQFAGPITYTYSYDNLGRITQASGSDGSIITYTYDANGNVTTLNRQ